MGDQPIAVSLFDKTTEMMKPWAEAGVLCYCVDIQHPPGEQREGNIIRVGADIHRWMPPRGHMIFGAAFPPCTHLAVSGARWFKGKGLYALADSIALFARAADILEALRVPYLLENPVSTISTYWRKSDYAFDPCDYAGYPGGEDDIYTKKTCLWTGGGASSCRHRAGSNQSTAAACTCFRPATNAPIFAAPRRKDSRARASRPTIHLSPRRPHDPRVPTH